MGPTKSLTFSRGPKGCHELIWVEAELFIPLENLTNGYQNWWALEDVFFPASNMASHFRYLC